MRTRTPTARALGVVAALVLLTGCGEPNAIEPAAASTAPVVERSTDTGLRDVPAAGFAALPFLAEETAAQTLCRALGQRQWETAFAGPVRREVVDQRACLITGNRMRVELRTDHTGRAEFKPLRDAAVRDVSIAGHPGKLAEHGAAPYRATGLVSLLDGDPAGDPRRALLVRVDAGAHTREADPRSFRGPLEDMLTVLLEKLAEDATPMPAVDARGAVEFVSTPPAREGRVVDMPLPIAARQLCTAAAAVDGGKPEDVQVDAFGKCVFRSAGKTTVLTLGKAEGAYPNAVAGRPADLIDGRLHVLPRDGAPVSLVIERPGDTREFAVALVDALLLDARP